jgi:hypothetical protein
MFAILPILRSSIEFKYITVHFNFIISSTAKAFDVVPYFSFPKEHFERIYCFPKPTTCPYISSFFI